MKKTDIPQDPSVLDKFTKEVCYAVDESGKYVTALSRGWEIKASALGITWEDIEKKVEAARQEVLKGNASPILYFIELRVMDIGIVSAYTGFWKWTIKRHLNPLIFHKLSDATLQKYADLFEVTVPELKTMTAQ
ncbi:MAG: hypothetical protein H7259_08080 [Cytophagales bacterium]|nr:hypothetical protein [Cytophaga sp.]